MIRICIVYICLIFSGSGHSQNQTIDQLKNNLHAAQSPGDQAQLLLSLGKQFRAHDLDSAVTYLSNAQALSEKHGLTALAAQSMFFKTTALNKQQRFDDASTLLYQGLQYCQQHQLQIEKGLFLSGIASQLEKEGLYYEALDSMRKSLSLFYDNERLDYASVVITNMSVAFQNVGLLDSALIYIQKSIDYKESQDLAHQAVNDYGNMGILYLEMTEPQLALEYHRKALSVIDTTTDLKNTSWLLTNIGQVFRKENKLDSALYYGQQALIKAVEHEGPFIIMNASQLLGSVYQAMGTLDSSKKYFEKGLEAMESLHQVNGQTTMKCHLGDVLIDMGQPQKALEHLEWSYRTALKNKALPNISWSTELLSKAYAAEGDYENAFHYSKLHKTYYDSIRNIEQNKHLIGLERQFKTNRQAAQLTAQNMTIQSQRNRYRMTVLLSIIALLIFAGIFLYLRTQQKIKSKEAELKLELEKSRIQQLEELDQMKSTFFANISHEIRTPLTLIMSPVINALDQVKSIPNLTEAPLKIHHLQLIQRNTQRLQHLVDQILDLSKIDGGYMQLYLVKGDIIQFIKMLAYSFESLAERQNIDYQIQMPAHLSDAVYDEDKFEKIILNLLSNAFKYTPSGGRIQCVVKIANEHLNISIQDSGPGLSEEDRSKIFNRYFQIDHGQGTGIGLALVAELVELYGGHIRVDSNEGEGANFQLNLPYLTKQFENRTGIHWRSETHVAQSMQAEPPPRAEIEYMSEQSPISKEAPLMLIVEDNEELRSFIGETMSSRFKIETAKDGQDGLSKAISSVPDIIISDVMMPNMDGLAMCQEIKTNEKTSHIPVILLTARAGDEVKLKGLKTGADDYITKPFSGSELSARASNLVHQRQLLKKKFSTQPPIAPGLRQGLSVMDSQFLEKVNAVIDRNLDNEQFSVEDLAHEVAFSRSQLHRKLKAIVGQSPTEIIRDIRLTKAMSLLQSGDGNVSEIAYKVGYSNLSYFTKSFKEKFGHLPSEYL